MPLKTFIRKLKTLFFHINNRTLVKHIKHKFIEHKYNKRKQKWEKSKASDKLYRYKLPEKITMDFPTEEILSEIICWSNFELDERYLIQHFLKSGEIFVDIGANIGLFSLIAAKSVGKTGRVFAFEPTSSTIKLLNRNVKLNRFRNVICLQLALSFSNEKKIMFTSQDGYSAWNSFAMPSKGRKFEEEIVESTTIDDFVNKYNLIGKISFMKIDIEGWEIYALKGGRKTLSRLDAPHLLVEFTDENAQLTGNSCAALYRELCNLGFHIFNIDVNHKTIYRESLKPNYPYINLLASKNIEVICDRLGFKLLTCNHSHAF